MNSLKRHNKPNNHILTHLVKIFNKNNLQNQSLIFYNIWTKCSFSALTSLKTRISNKYYSWIHRGRYFYSYIASSIHPHATTTNDHTSVTSKPRLTKEFTRTKYMQSSKLSGAFLRWHHHGIQAVSYMVCMLQVHKKLATSNYNSTQKTKQLSHPDPSMYKIK